MRKMSSRQNRFLSRAERSSDSRPVTRGPPAGQSRLSGARAGSGSLLRPGPRAQQAAGARVAFSEGGALTGGGGEGTGPWDQWVPLSPVALSGGPGDRKGPLHRTRRPAGCGTRSNEARPSPASDPPPGQKPNRVQRKGRRRGQEPPVGAAFRSPRSTEGHNTALRQGAVRPSREREGLGGQPAPAGKNTHSCLHTHTRTHAAIASTAARSVNVTCSDRATRPSSLVLPCRTAACGRRTPRCRVRPSSWHGARHSRAPRTSGHIEAPTHTSRTLRQNVPFSARDGETCTAPCFTACVSA